MREHQALLEKLSAEVVRVRRPSDLDQIEGLVIPGGESTAISKLITNFGMLEPLRNYVAERPVLGTCAGLILLSNQVEGRLADQELIGGLDIVTSRNAYGSQLDSFEADVNYESTSEHVAFIRAPKILDTKETKMLARFGQEVVAVQQGKIFGACYHPEITGSTLLHSLFLAEIEKDK